MFKAVKKEFPRSPSTEFLYSAIGGEEDFFYPIRETAAGIPNAKLILYEGFGHDAMFEKTQFQEDVLAFLNESY